jgi:DNA/RNA-binding domain of Phe-tRNA-synthetase-like protein
VLTRRWVWRQSNKDKVTAKTSSVFMPIDVMEGLPRTLTEDVMERVSGYLRENMSGEVVSRDILTREKRSAKFVV